MRRSAMTSADSRRDTVRAGGLSEVLFEFTAVGNSVRVSAVDPDTLVEATITGPVTAGESALRQAALRKLRYLLAKRRAQFERPNGSRYA